MVNNHRRGAVQIGVAAFLLLPPVAWLVWSLVTDLAQPTATGVPAVKIVAERTAAWKESAEPAEARRVARLELPPIAEREALAQSDPRALARLGRQWYTENVREYRCVLVKQERLGRKLTPLQEIELRYREQPYAVYMLWRENADGARRALHTRAPEYIDKDGQQLARVEPNGALVRLITTDVFLPIHGPEARKASRRTIDECGFRASFELMEQINSLAEERGVLKIWYGGPGTIDGRPTFQIYRELPYEGPGGAYPDARLVLHLDQEWLLPVAVYSYADTEQRELLGSYVFSRVELNPGLGDEAFQF